MTLLEAHNQIYASKNSDLNSIVYHFRYYCIEFDPMNDDDIFDDFGNLDSDSSSRRSPIRSPLLEFGDSLPANDNSNNLNSHNDSPSRSFRQNQESNSNPNPINSRPESNSKPSKKKKNPHIELQINLFTMTEEQRSSFIKRLPRGFTLLKKQDFPVNDSPFKGNIEYTTVKKQPKIASEELLEKLPIPILGAPTTIHKERQPSNAPNSATGGSYERPHRSATGKPGLRLNSQQLPEGKSKQTEKVKSILQKFRKHQRYPVVAGHLNKIGFMQGFNEIEAEIKKNIHTIESFKERSMFLLENARKVAVAESTSEALGEIMEEFLFQVEQAKKVEFENNLVANQKNIDKITREITDIKESGNWYLRRKKRGERNFDEKEVMHISDLVRKLPPAYLVGVWEIVEERPFVESAEESLLINFSQLKTKKVREIEAYVKLKHTVLAKSRERKRDKIQRKREEKKRQREEEEARRKEEQEGKQQEGEQVQGQGEMELEPLVQGTGTQGDEKEENIKSDMVEGNPDSQNDILAIDDMFPPSVEAEGQPQQEENKPENSVSDEREGEIELAFDDIGFDLNNPTSVSGESDSSDSSLITDDEDSDY